MASELRVRTNFLGGLVEDNPLASGATVLTSAGLASLPAIGSTQHFPIILDPDGRAGNPEIAYVTAHTALATTATITKGQEGTTARAHDRDTPWLHGPTVKDFDAAAGGVGLIAQTVYKPSETTIAVTSTSASFADIDAVNLVVTFVAPPSGKVNVYWRALREAPSGVNIKFALRDGSGLVAGTPQYSGHAISASANVNVVTHMFPIIGLTPGTSYTYKAAGQVSSGTGNVYVGNGAGANLFGPAVLEVWAVNV